MKYKRDEWKDDNLVQEGWERKKRWHFINGASKIIPPKGNVCKCWIEYNASERSFNIHSVDGDDFVSLRVNSVMYFMFHIMLLLPFDNIG